MKGATGKKPSAEESAEETSDEDDGKKKKKGKKSEKKEEGAEDEPPKEQSKLQLRSRNMLRKAHSQLLNKTESDDMWDDIIDTLSSDNDWISDTIKESDSIDKLYGTKKGKKNGNPASRAQAPKPQK